MDIWIYTGIAVLIVSLASFVGIIAFSLSRTMLNWSVPILVSVAVGAMLGDSFIHLIPEAFEESQEPMLVSLLIIAGMLLFFVLEKFFHWHHSHGEGDIDEFCGCEHEHGKIKPVGYMVLISDGFHNFVDGIVIGASFLVSVPVGIATTVAVLFHEIPQELGNFGVLIHAGYSKTRALFVNFLSALSAFVGAIFVFVFSSITDNLDYVLQVIIPIAAGSFIYIAAADLIPELQKTKGVTYSLIQFVAFIVGVSVMASLVLLE